MPKHIKDNWTPSRDDYDKFHKSLGHKYRISHKIIAIIRSYCGQNYIEVPTTEEGLAKLALSLRRESEKKIVRMDECIRPRKLALIKLIAQDESTMNSTQVRVDKVSVMIDDFCSSITRVTLHKNLVRYLKYLERNTETLKAILEAELKPQEKTALDKSGE